MIHFFVALIALYLVFSQSPRIRELVFWLIVILLALSRESLHWGYDFYNHIPTDNFLSGTGDPVSPLDNETHRVYDI